MKTIYLDHNIAHYFVRGFNSASTEAGERRALEDCLARAPNIRFALSFWNMLEAARETGHRSGDSTLSNQYADFWTELKPLHLPLAFVIEREEMKRCVFREIGLTHNLPPVPIFNEHLSQVLSLAGIKDVLAGVTLRDMIREFAQNKQLQKELRAQEQLVPRAMATMQQARLDGRAQDRGLAREINRRWFCRLLPERKRDGSPIAPDEQRNVVQALAAEPDRVYTQCPSVWAERVLSDVRAGFSNRAPEREDALDLMHAIPAMAYCDAFVSNDGHLRECARQTARRIGRNLIVARRLSEVLPML